MTLFWILAGFMVFLAVLFVALPLVRRAPARDETQADRLNVSIRKDQLAELEADVKAGTLSPDQLEEGRLELERRLLAEARAGAPKVRVTGGSRWLAAGLGVALPAAAVGLYLHLGRIDAMAPIPTPTEVTAHDITPAQLGSMVQRLADRLRKEPDDAEGWMMLGRSYAVMQRYDDAVQAYQKAYALVGDNPDVLTGLADAVAMASGGKFTDDSVRLIDRALEVDPSHRKALWLAGTVAYEKQDYPKALALWERLAAVLPEGSDVAQTIQSNISEVRDLIAGKGGPPAAPMFAEAGPADAAAAPPPAGPMAPAAPPMAGAGTAPKGGAARVEGTVSVSPDLVAKLDPNATLFIFARAPQGPRMPLAILRRRASDLPATFELDKDMAMMPAMSLAQFDQVMIGARVSRSGNATPQSGDLQGMTGPVAVGSTGVQVVINEVVP
jgi:cytochrome c-type biogenesis protein CcmH